LLIIVYFCYTILCVYLLFPPTPGVGYNYKMERKVKFVEGEYYHIYNRTISNAPEFKNYNDAKRLALTFLIANSTKSGDAFQQLRNNKNTPQQKIIEILNKGEKLTDILCYAIMPDHYHLLLRETKENGVVNFIHRCNTSIAKYLNTKGERKGPVFESRFKSKHIDSNEYLLHLSLYIHLNPLDFLVGKEWREHGIKNWNDSKKHLLNYPWSSLNSFINNNQKNPIISETEIITEQFNNNQKEYESFLKEWSEKENLLLGEVEE